MGIKERLLERRRATPNMTQEKLGECIGVTGRTIRNWESSFDKRVPDADQMILLAKTLNTTVGYLTGETDDPAPGGGASMTAHNITQNNQSVHGDVHNNTMTVAPTFAPQPMPTTPVTSAPWWTETLTHAYEMERTGAPRLAEAAAIVQMAADVLKRAVQETAPANAAV